MTSPSPFDLSPLPAPLRWIVRRLCRVDIMEQWYASWVASGSGDGAAFLAHTVRCLDRRCEFRHHSGAGDLSSLAPGQPLVIVANHPLGAVEGILLVHHLLQYRPDLKVVANKLLMRIPEFKDIFIGVDILSDSPSNRGALRELDRHLACGGAVLIFPAGTVGNLNWRQGVVEDPPWHTTAARMALRHRAWCLPVHVEGRNDWWFYASASIHKRLRTLLLPRVMVQPSDRPLTITVGRALKLADIGLDRPRAATDYLRVATELLQGIPAAASEANRIREVTPVPAPRSLAHLAQYELLRVADRAVYCVPYHALGDLSGHLAAERERTFRAAGEGTGAAADSDEFDPHYWHLIAWDLAENRLIGAYRAFRVRDALESGGKKRLYSRSIFRFPDALLAHFADAIEVGRSFVTEHYQRDPRALDLLWQGLGALMLRNPDCHTFIGCVSISGGYTPLVRGLLQDTLLAAYGADQEIRRQVVPAQPFRAHRTLLSPELIASLANVSAINHLLGHCGLEVRVPVLIRHYLALNGRFIDFSVNRQFSNSLDGLIVVDLRQAPERYLKRYLGDAGRTEFQNNWSLEDVA